MFALMVGLKDKFFATKNSIAKNAPQLIEQARVKGQKV